MLQLFDTLGKTEVISYVEGNVGSRACVLGSPIMTSQECKTACGRLNKKVLLSTLNDGQPCFISKKGCRQDGKQNRRSSLVCKAQGNIVICTNTTWVYIFLYRKFKDIILNAIYIFLDNQWQCVLPHQLLKVT